jgi:hypothetical protein
LQIGSNPKHFAIGEICNLVLNFENEKLPDGLHGHVLRLRISETKRETPVENLGTDRTYHAGARFLRQLILDHHAKEARRKVKVRHRFRLRPILSPSTVVAPANGESQSAQ